MHRGRGCYCRPWRCLDAAVVAGGALHAPAPTLSLLTARRFSLLTHHLPCSFFYARQPKTPSRRARVPPHLLTITPNATFAVQPAERVGSARRYPPPVHGRAEDKTASPAHNASQEMLLLRAILSRSHAMFLYLPGLTCPLVQALSTPSDRPPGQIPNTSTCTVALYVQVRFHNEEKAIIRSINI